MEEIILKDLLLYYLGLDDESIEIHLKEIYTATKERVKTINDLQVIIYSNDHNPPHFHVKTKNLNIDAKFRIEDCELISGEISSKDLKKIKAFYLSPKGKKVLEMIWSKKNLN
ncbi:DUF4160 domain-containing protein [Flavobacterium sp. CYK-55]|uniref:DUF4160 domain-containing protein n=1 Tax=Flavobacterium sp. CYK-55 TaxID=2835529 RepID=UPI001BCC27B0|nr:DUF4160 domain-containing protein [Flavobacterium sp. CYK-55]MBS7788317.1 DUF4160 domain-containing protein [Flavobacterium sp. CYK-55]